MDSIYITVSVAAFPTMANGLWRIIPTYTIHLKNGLTSLSMTRMMIPSMMNGRTGGVILNNGLEKSLFVHLLNMLLIGHLMRLHKLRNGEHVTFTEVKGLQTTSCRI